MATIKEGYDSQPLEVRVYVESGKDMASVWTEMYCPPHEGEYDDREERLHYATISELIELRDEINEAIRQMAGV